MIGATSGNASSALARNRLGVPAMVFLVMSAAMPLSVVVGIVTTGYAMTGAAGIPLAFLAVAAILGVFSIGYVAMARRVANAGAFYAYIAQGLGRPLGVGAAWIALLAYNALQVGLYGAIGSAAGPLLEAWFGIDVAWWIVALVAWAVVAVLGALRVDISGAVLAVLLVAEVSLILVFDLADLLNPAGREITFDTLAPGNLFVPGAGAVLVLVLLGFVGFESAAVFSEESKDPGRTVPLATYLSVAIIGVLCALSAWAMTAATGPDRVVEVSRTEGGEAIFDRAGGHLGATVVDTGHALFLTSLVAAMIAFHNTTARYMFALGRERVLPSAFGRTSRSGAPVAGSLAQSLIGLAVILLFAAAGWDPLVHLFFQVGTSGGFGILVLIAATSISVIAYFARRASTESVWRRAVAPTIAAVALVGVVILAVVNFATLLGVASTDPLRWIVPGVFLAAALLGIAWGMVLKSARPDVYQTIGLGVESATVGVTPLVSTIRLPTQRSFAGAKERVRR